MTCEYVLADKMKNQFYERSNAIRSGARNSRYSDGTKRYGRTQSVKRRRPFSGVREVKYTETKKNKKALETRAEVKVKKRYIPPVFVAVLAVATVMMMFLVLSFSEVYESSNNVTKLEKQLETLKAEESELSLKLDEKNNLREIELVATTRLGMVKEDSLQKRFVSLSEGERIEVLENVETASEQNGGVMLSSILSALGNFFDRFK